MNKNLLILAIIIILAAGGIYYFNSGAGRNSPPPPQNNPANTQISGTQTRQNQIMISVDAKRWQFTPDVIRVKKGQQVKIIINNTDTTHGINLPDFNASGNDFVEFTADKTGEFIFRCNTYCGDGHPNMTGKIIVED